MTRFEFAFPNGPQKDQLVTLVDRLADLPEVVEIWLGGSFASGTADRYSDVDLRISVDSEALSQWHAPNFADLFGDPCPGVITMCDGDESVLHHIVLSNGEIFDFYVRRFPLPSVEEQIVPIGTRLSEFQVTSTWETSKTSPGYSEVNATEIERAIRNFWINTHKHRKVLNRDLDLMVHIGLQFERDLLRRLWTLKLTGHDEPRNKTIHTLSDQTRSISKGIGSRAYEVLGMPLQSRSQLVEAIETIRSEVSATGRALAESFGFAYPETLEAVVLTGWREWKFNNPVCDSEIDAVELVQ